jgi:hypothetical protein
LRVGREALLPAGSLGLMFWRKSFGLCHSFFPRFIRAKVSFLPLFAFINSISFISVPYRTITMSRTIFDDAAAIKKRKFSLRQLQGMTTIITAFVYGYSCFRLWIFMYSNSSSSSSNNNNNNKNTQMQVVDSGGDVAATRSDTSINRLIRVPTPPSPKSHVRLLPHQDAPSATRAVRFLFVIGLEGTGHHLLQSMASQSPSIEQLREMNIYPKMTKRLGKLLYGDPDPPPESQKLAASPRLSESLWGSMDSCAVGGDGATFETHHHQDDDGVGDRGSSTPSVEERTIELLKAIERKARLSQEQQRIVTIPFNVLRTMYTMASYPHLHGKCRGLRYPDLDLWYRVCERAGVQCEHVYIHRDPYEILYSTNVKRSNNRNKTPFYVIHLYKSMLSIIYTQLSTHAHRTVGCYGMLERGKYNVSSQSSWKYQVGDLLGWTNTVAYDEFFAKEYSPPKPNGNLTRYKKDLAQPALASAMQSFVILNDRVKQLCERTASAPVPVLVARNE